MEPVQQHLRVTFRFPVHFTVGVFSPDNPVLRGVLADTDDPRPAKVLAVVDSGVAEAHPTVAGDIERYATRHGDTMRLAGPVQIVPGGERAKNDRVTLDRLYEAIHAAGLCRHSYVLIVGGGAVLDVAGYAAATAHRGIRQIRVPTTVLAQDDSAMGVKNGVNGFGTKNYFGTFAPPTAVINDSAFLRTLDRRDWIGGLSEAVKAALIKDPDFFAALETEAPALVARDASAMDAVVRRSARLHLDHIAGGGDPFELGSSRPLDFGHWAAHRLEQMTGHRLRHGEAVSIGLALDSTYSHLAGLLPDADWHRIVDLLLALGLPVWAPELGAHLDAPDHAGSVLDGLAEFREHLGGRLTVILLEGIGRPVDVHDIGTEGMIRSIDVLKQIDAAGSSRPGDDGLFATAPARGSS